MGSSEDNSSSSLEISDQVQNAVVVIETSTVGSVGPPTKVLPPVPPKSPRVLSFKLRYKNRSKAKSSSSSKPTKPLQNKLVPVTIVQSVEEYEPMEAIKETRISPFYEDIDLPEDNETPNQNITPKEEKVNVTLGGNPDIKLKEEETESDKNEEISYIDGEDCDKEADKEVNLIIGAFSSTNYIKIEDNDTSSVTSAKDDDSLTERNEDTSASSSWDSDMTTENENGIVVGTMTVTPFSTSTHATATASTVQCTPPPPPIPSFPYSDPELDSSSSSQITSSTSDEDKHVCKEKIRIYDSVPFSSSTHTLSSTLVRPLLARPDAEGKGVEDEENSFTDSLSEEHNYQNIMMDSKHASHFSSFNNSRGMDKDAAVKNIIHSANGVTTIELDPTNPAPVIHAVINLPPRRASLIKKRRRTEDLSYQKSSRLSQMMVADYKAGGIDRPGGSSSTTGSILSLTLGKSNVNKTGSKALGINALIPDKAKASLSRSGSLVKGNVEKVGKSMSSVKKKVGSWYNRRVRTSVENLSSELKLDGLKMTMSFPFSSSSNDPNGNDTDSQGRRSRSVSTARDYNGDECDNSSASNLNMPFTIDENVDNKSIENESFMIQGQNEFEELRKVVKQGGDFCKDLAVVLHERSELEAQYAKGLSKLSAKLLKASKEATGSVAHAWQAVAVQIDTQAELHRQWSTALSEEVARPLRNSTETQHKIRKSVEVLVEKTTRNLAEWRTAETKAKRQCFSSSKEFEKLQESTSNLVGSTTLSNVNHSNGNNNTNANNNPVIAEVRARSRILSVPPMEKDPIKLEAKRRKAEEAVRRADIEYYTFCVRSERARLEWEGAIRNGSTCLRTLEEEKLSLLRDLAVKYFQHLNDLAPKLVQSAESLEEPVKNCSIDQDMHSIVDIRRHAGAEQLLPDFYAEDTSNLMKKERRKEALQKFLYLIKQDLEREKKGAVGVETLAKAIAEAPKIDNAHHDISDKLYYMKSMLLYLEASRCKLDNAFADVEGRQRSNNPITQYMRHQRDKQGLPQTILKVPSWARDECLIYSSGGGGSVGEGSAGSSSPDWNDRGNGDGTSNQHDTDFDEFSSEGSENIEVFDEESKAANLISVPSIGSCRVIYDYDANMFDELTIRTGDSINIHDKQEDGWWLGELNGMIGIFPATYVEELTEQPPE